MKKRIMRSKKSSNRNFHSKRKKTFKRRNTLKRKKSLKRKNNTSRRRKSMMKRGGRPRAQSSDNIQTEREAAPVAQASAMTEEAKQKIDIYIERSKQNEANECYEESEKSLKLAKSFAVGDKKKEIIDLLAELKVRMSPRIKLHSSDDIHNLFYIYQLLSPSNKQNYIDDNIDILGELLKKYKDNNGKIYIEQCMVIKISSDFRGKTYLELVEENPGPVALSDGTISQPKSLTFSGMKCKKTNKWSSNFFSSKVYIDDLLKNYLVEKGNDILRFKDIMSGSE